MLFAAVLAALLFAIGCGDGGSDEPEVTVKTGSLSKAEFIEKADAICEAARTEFEAKSADYFQAHQSYLGKPDKEDELFVGVLDSVVTPNFEGEIKRISALGAPKAYAPEAAAFLETLQKQLGEVHDDISKLETRYPFKESANVALKAGMQGCGESFG